jgi:hyaluronoglucosaminidase
LGSTLHPAIDIFYTGPEICSPTISLSDVEAFAKTACRQPILWDNYPVNDLAMQPELHIGPILGRDPLLVNGVRGILINPMNLAEATKIPLLTWAAYLNDPVNYDPDNAWNEALIATAGKGKDKDSAAALHCLAENSLTSFLSKPSVHKLTELTEKVMAALEKGEALTGNSAVADLRDYLTSLDEGCYHLKNRMDNLALRNNLLPWIEVAEHWLWMARYALQVIEAVEQGQSYKHPLSQMKENLDSAQQHPKRTDISILAMLDMEVSVRLTEMHS